jgi:hypothetical protein
VVEVEPREDAGRLSEAFRFRDLPKRGMAGRVERSESSKAAEHFASFLWQSEEDEDGANLVQKGKKRSRFEKAQRGVVNPN